MGHPLVNTLLSSPYTSYAYAYPHKSAYRQLLAATSLESEWCNEKKDALSLYLHIPFCEMRCGFCNLFTTTNPRGSIVERYVERVTTEAEVVREALGEIRVATMALGGGTPTYLDLESLSKIFDTLYSLYAIYPGAVPISVETSPGTATGDRLTFLKEKGVSRLSIGVQSFIEEEVKSIGRAQQQHVLHSALSRIKESNFPLFNIDLIYGVPSQTNDSWRYSLESALEYGPQEIYLYPLYTRPLTGIGRRGGSWNDHRLKLYEIGREFLLLRGYEQVSMRMFRRPNTVSGTSYCCQKDGMIGLGCGARSYTSRLHYSREYAVSSSAVKEILHNYLESSARDFQYASYGFRLNDEERRRRFVLQSLLQCEGLTLSHYRSSFETELLDDLPEIQQLIDAELALLSGDHLVLSEAGVSLSDAIGPFLYSDRVRRLENTFELR